MKKEYFVEQPSIEMKPGAKVTKDSEHHYKSESVEQVLKDLVLETILTQAGTNGINTYSSKSYIRIELNEGDILLFDKNRGFYLPSFPVTTIEDAIADISSLEEVHYPEEEFKEVDDESAGNEERNTDAD